MAPKRGVSSAVSARRMAERGCSRRPTNLPSSSRLRPLAGVEAAGREREEVGVLGALKDVAIGHSGKACVV